LPHVSVSTVVQVSKWRFSGECLLRARKAAELSRFRLCYRIEFMVGPRSIVRYEAGLGIPNVDTAVAIAEALNVRLKDLGDA
jgi:transcriptional regulator with XRE-family HTH domain